MLISSSQQSIASAKVKVTLGKGKKKQLVLLGMNF